MKLLYLWQKDTWQDFPDTLFTQEDACVLVGNGAIAAYTKDIPKIVAPLFIVLESSLDSALLARNIQIISSEKWLELILQYDKVVSL